MTVTGKAKRRDAKAWGNDLYSANPAKLSPVSIRAIPYSLWANRKEGEMLVWLNVR